MKLSQIWIYPIKSMAGISLHHAQVLPKGLQFDRRWMLVDANNTFMTQRTYPKMALFHQEINETHLTVNFSTDSIKIPLRGSNGNCIETKVWNDTVSACEVNPTFSEWFTEILGMRCKLLNFPEEHPRPVDPQYRISDDHVGLADGYPFLIIGQASLDDLNSRLQAPVPINRFRPNFVFTGSSPYDEDNWRHFSIGSNRFVVVKPCSRCIMTTINHKTAEKGTEPLKTLATYRKTNNKIYFGQNVIALDYKSVSVGDTIAVN